MDYRCWKDSPNSIFLPICAQMKYLLLAWGEPLLAGLDFSKRPFRFKKYNPGKQISNSLQTNGTLINHEWVDFFGKRLSCWCFH